MHFNGGIMRNFMNGIVISRDYINNMLMIMLSWFGECIDNDEFMLTLRSVDSGGRTFV